MSKWSNNGLLRIERRNASGLDREIVSRRARRGNGSLEVGIVAAAAVALALMIASAIKLNSAVKHWFGRPARDRELTPVARADT